MKRIVKYDVYFQGKPKIQVILQIPSSRLRHRYEVTLYDLSPIGKIPKSGVNLILGIICQYGRIRPMECIHMHI